MTNEKPSNGTVTNKIIKKSQTLYNNAIKTPLSSSVSLMRKAGRSMDIARSKSVARFAAQPKPVTPAPSQPHIAPSRHPIARKVDAIRQQQQRSQAPQTLKQIKESAIADAMQKTVPAADKKGFFKRNLKFINIFSISLAVLIIVGCVVYLNMPNISVRIASAQAGIDAKFPEYHPDGYSVNGPVAYNNGEVTINFRANTGDANFKIKQTKSTWDSSAVRNKVNKDSGGEFITTEEKGLTIYTYNGNAAWVNGGILYTVDGNAPLSGDQIRRIATSL
ncbi:MAG: hypothetical protein WCI79_01980 [Candidatus Saccharibacteria bacterium]